MKRTKKGFTRRDFLKGAAGAAIIGATGAKVGYGQDEKDDEKKAGKAPEVKKKVAPTMGPSKVVLIRDEKVIDENRKVDTERIEKMLDEGVVELLGVKTPDEAWKELLSPKDTLGIKSNVWRFLATPSALEQAIKQRAMKVGIPEERIDIDDRRVLGSEVFQKATALINARPLRTHHWSGVGSLIKNYIMFHPRPPIWHDDSCADLAGLWDLPIVKGKTRLNILVMLTPLFHGKGPHHFQAKYTWPYKGLIISKDPVAADATGLRILEAQRKVHFGQDEPFSVPPKHIEVAEKKFKLGIADPKRIRLIKMGWKEDILI
jgi:hypothetical protein